MKAQSLALSLFLFSINLWAGEPTFLLQDKFNTDDLEKTTLMVDYKNQRHDFFYNYASEKEILTQLEYKLVYSALKSENEEFQVLEFYLNWIQRHSRLFQWEIALGYALNQFSEKSFQFLHWNGRILHTPSPSVTHSFQSERKFFGGNLEGELPLLKGLSIINNSYNLYWTPHSHWRFISRNLLAHINDGNIRKKNEVSLLYGFKISDPWIWIGLGGEYLSHTKSRATGYWSPSYFQSYGLRSEFSFSASQDIQLFGGINVSKLKEEDFNQGDGSYLSLGLQYGSRNKSHWRLLVVQQESRQGGQLWEESTIQWKGLFLF